MMNIYAKFSLNPFTKYKDIALHETGVNGRQPDRRTARQTDNRHNHKT